MNDQPNDPLLMNHDADGIRELDNLLPHWWVWLFYLSVVFSIVYMFYYHVFRIGDLQASEYAKQFKAGEEIKQSALSKFEASLGSLQPSSDSSAISQGQHIFMIYCAPCHRNDGGGLVGPNLCDDYWIHGSSYHDSLKTIVNGIPEKGMITWRGVLKPAEIQAVASYIYKFRGTAPPNPKPPENQQPAANVPSEFE